MVPSIIQAVFAGVTLLILWSVTLLGAVLWILRTIKSTRDEILKDFNTKHEANALTVRALHELVIRHDVILNPEFITRSNGRAHTHK